nr:hypothetical protein [uncultured Carboxylicivirga sp.]
MDLQEAIRHLDIIYGEGFGHENPALVIEYMKAYGLNNLEHQLKPVMDHLTQFLNQDDTLKQGLRNIEYALKR